MSIDIALANIGHPKEVWIVPKNSTTLVVRESGKRKAMEKSFKLIIMTPDKEFYKGEVVKLNSEGGEGRFGILPNHISMVSDLVPTITTFQDINDKEFHGFTSNGVIKVKNNVVTMLCSAAEWSEDIDEERAKSAKERAGERLKNKDNIDVERAERALRRSLMRLKVSSIK